MISKAVPPGWDFLIALRGSWSLRFPLMWGTREHNLWELGTAFALSPYIILLRETEAMEPVPWPIPLSFFEYWSILINVIPLFYFYQHLEKIVKNKLGLLRTTKKKSKMYVFKVLFERKMKKNQLFWLIMKISKKKTGLSLCRNYHRFSAFWLRSKCSICSYQLNIWYGLHCRSRILNWFLTDWVYGWACSPGPAGCNGIALLPYAASLKIQSRNME